MIPQQTVNEIYNRVKVYDIVSKYVTLTNDGSGHKGLCPFHNENTPSFKVTPHKGKGGYGIYKCFGCGKGGNNPVKFIMDFKNIDYPSALKEIAKMYQIPMVNDNNIEPINDFDKDSMYLLNDFAVEFYHNILCSTDNIHHVKSRGINEKTIKKFCLGFAPQYGEIFKIEALNHKYDLPILEKTHLVNKSSKDFFSERIMFPLFNIDNKIVGFAGRTIQQDNDIKYLNSKESQIYIKNELLYGLNFAKQAIQGKNECILVEGYIDCIMLHQVGIENVVACGGTALTLGHIELIKKLTSNLTIIFDGDEAGKDATKKAALRAYNKELVVNILDLPNNEDPDSYVNKHGKEEFEKLLFENIRRYSPPQYIELNEELFITYAIHSSNSSSNLTKIIEGIELFAPILEDKFLRQIAECIGENKEKFSDSLTNHKDENIKVVFDTLLNQSTFEVSDKDIILFKLQLLRKAYIYQLQQIPFLNKFLYKENKNKLNSIIALQENYMSQLKDFK